MPPSQPTWTDEALDLVRAASGGLLFGVPLLYTVEVWWIGSHTEPEQMLLVLALLLPLLLLLNIGAGFRKSEAVNVLQALEDAVEALAVGLLMTTAVLVLLRQVTFDMPLTAALGRIVSECIPFCLGIGVARLLLHGDPGMSDEEEAASDDELGSSVSDLAATALGAAFVGLSIAPTDEVQLLAAAMSPQWQILVVAASIVISYAVVFIAGFTGQDRRHRQRGVFQHPVTETLVTYVVAVLIAAVLLWVFQRDLAPAGEFLAVVTVLGLPTAVGGAVGRLAL